jgi:ATP-dependent RNA helicase DHX37/DHR1
MWSGVVESEEVELGARRDDIGDGDHNNQHENQDTEALDSEEDEENQELQIDTEQSDGTSLEL